ncbi:hypothetical protein H0H93_013988 [Arthromyces matolae]|nr:hypothetical protein H0H93_013988 [Arthromyces matolae]
MPPNIHSPPQPPLRPVDRVREDLLIRRPSTHGRTPSTYPPIISPPAYASNTRHIPAIAMWAQSARSERDGREEWAVYYTTQPVRIEPLQEGDDNILRAGDVFDIMLFDRGGNMYDYMSLRTELIEEPDSPSSITLQTRNADNTEIRLRIPIACVTMTLNTLMNHIDSCKDDGEVDIFPTLLVTEGTPSPNLREPKFVSQEDRDRIDPEGKLANYALILPI